jgi:hypothetical protein
MPLLKLWNSIRRRSKSAPEQPARSARSSAEGRKSSRTTGRQSKRPRLSLFGGGGPHGALRKLVEPLQAATVLEISVGDGSRAIAILQTLGDSQQVRYVAIDQFEMSGGEVTLKDFHKTMRSEGIRPHVFPEPINRGLLRVANTIGPVDLVIIATGTDQWQTPETLSLLARVTHGETVVLFQDEESWERFEPASPIQASRAA